MDQSVTPDAFELVHAIAAKRLARRRLAVIDATNVRPEDRKQLIELARRYHALPTAIVFDLPEDFASPATRSAGPQNPGQAWCTTMSGCLRKSMRGLDREGFRGVHVLRSEESVAAATIVREPSVVRPTRVITGRSTSLATCMAAARRLEPCLTGLASLDRSRSAVRARTSQCGAALIFVGDLVDRGPDSPGVLRLVMNMVEAGTALAVPGNHDLKLVKKLAGQAT